MSQFLALLAASLFGIADFAGGIGARRIMVLRVTTWSQLIGVPLLVIILLVVGWDDVRVADLGYGAVAGAFGFVGLVALYGALAAGTMSIVAPLTGALGALIAVLWGVVAGEHIAFYQWIGIALVIIAITLVAWDHTHAKLTIGVAARVLVAAATLSAFFIALDYTAEAAGQWPLIAARGVSISLGFALLLGLRQVAPPPRETLPALAVAGNGDIAANGAALAALQTGPLGITVALTSIYPAFTALAAVLFLQERPTVIQRFGILLALVAATLLVV